MSEKKIHTVAVSALYTIALPQVPNFVRVFGGPDAMSIAVFSDNALETIGEAWTKRLKERAAEIRESGVESEPKP